MGRLKIKINCNVLNMKGRLATAEAILDQNHSQVRTYKYIPPTQQIKQTHHTQLQLKSKTITIKIKQHHNMVHNAQWTPAFGSATKWSRSQDKIFEQSLVLFPETTPDRWDRIASQIPGKSAPEVRHHYEDLVHDVMEIDAGRVELPRYEDALSSAKAKGRDAERRKGVPWTEQEHILFLAGLEKYGKGDWRSISRNSVVTRTPTQVASHAQKYFLRLNADGSTKKEKKRSSIHDITGKTKIQSTYQNWAGPSAMEPIDQGASFGFHGIGYSM